jgi:hypothetical protein
VVLAGADTTAVAGARRRRACLALASTKRRALGRFDGLGARE